MKYSGTLQNTAGDVVLQVFAFNVSIFALFYVTVAAGA